MTQTEFVNQLVRLQEVYGTDLYPDGCAGPMYKKVRSMSAECWEAAIDKVLLKYIDPNKPPTFVDVEEILSKIPLKMESVESLNYAERIIGAVSGGELSTRLRPLIADLESREHKI